MRNMESIKKPLMFHLVALVFILMPFIVEGVKSNLVKVEVKGVTQDPLSGSPMVLLEDKEGERVVPIWIGYSEARSIMMELEGIPPKRPMTHDLLKNIIQDLKARVKSVIITEIKNNTFYANIILERAGSDLTIDSRPSDAIALALRAKSPIFLQSTVFSQAQTIDISPYSQELIKEKYGFSFQDLTPTLSEYFKTGKAEGVLISEIYEGSLAEKGGLKQGDIILKVNDEQVRNASELSKALGKFKGEDAISINIARSGEAITLSLSRKRWGE